MAKTNKIQGAALKLVEPDTKLERPVHRALKAPVKLGVVRQVEVACNKRNRLAATMGFLLGGFIPIACYFVAHQEVIGTKPLWEQPSMVLVLGGLVFSMKTVYGWGKLAFEDKAKALGFVLLAEGTMVISTTQWLGIVALAYLVVINGIATACQLAKPAK